MTLPRPRRLLVCAVLVACAAAAAAGCGGGGTPASAPRPRLPHGVGHRLAAQSDAVAARLARHDGCGAAAAARTLERSLRAADAAGEVPARFWAPLASAIRGLVAHVRCTPAPAPAAQEPQAPAAPAPPPAPPPVLVAARPSRHGPPPEHGRRDPEGRPAGRGHGHGGGHDRAKRSGEGHARGHGRGGEHGGGGHGR